MLKRNIEYFCIKKNIKITTNNCSECFKKGGSGYENYSFCIDHNLITKTEAKKKNLGI